MKMVKQLFCVGLLFLLSHPLSACDMGGGGEGISTDQIMNSLSYEKYLSSDDIPATNWAEIANGILFYSKEKPYYEFTNFYSAPFTVAGREWPTSEHFYQAMKFTDQGLQEQIRAKKTARGAFEFAQRLKDKVRKDWKQVSLSMMGLAVYQKFAQNHALQELLLNTGSSTVLIEDAKDNDRFFGAGADYKGANYLGRILMLVRLKLEHLHHGVSISGLIQNTND